MSNNQNCLCYLEINPFYSEFDKETHKKCVFKNSLNNFSIFKETHLLVNCYRQFD